MNEVADVVCEVYAAGAKLVFLDGGIGVEGEIPGELKGKARVHRVELLEAVGGDPLQGPGWEVRTALYRQALRWLDGEIGQMGLEGARRERAATDALCRQDVADRLNRVWCDGTFDEFRGALREYVRAGLAAARGKALDSNLRVGQSIGPGSRAERSRTR
jgi:hypothetical protein